MIDRMVYLIFQKVAQQDEEFTQQMQNGLTILWITI